MLSIPAWPQPCLSPVAPVSAQGGGLKSTEHPNSACQLRPGQGNMHQKWD